MKSASVPKTANTRNRTRRIKSVKETNSDDVVFIDVLKDDACKTQLIASPAKIESNKHSTTRSIIPEEIVSYINY